MQHDRRDYNERIQDSLPAEQGGIPEKEPVFLLRGQDKVAHIVVLVWAQLLEAYGGDAMTVAAARKQANMMEWWAQNVKMKLPDL